MSNFLKEVKLMNLYPYDKESQRIKSDVEGIGVDRAFIAHFQVSDVNAIAASTTKILAATALTEAAQVITENITNPSVPRNIKIVGNAAGIAGNVTIKGTNYNGDFIIETLVLNGITEVEGNKAFKTVNEIDLPIQAAAGNTVSVGFGDKIGLPYKLYHNTVLAAYLDNIRENTSPVVTTSPTNLENNTVDLSSVLNGKIVDVYLIV